MSDVLWRPSAAKIESARATAFRRTVNERLGLALRDWEDLRRWSIEDRPAFWDAVWRFAEIRSSREPARVLAAGSSMREDRWFEGARLNFAENLLRQGDGRTAIVHRDERGAVRRLSFPELRAETARVAGALRAAGVTAGDRVAGLLPNVPEALVGALAAASVGALWTSCSPDFGPAAVLDRFGQIAPKVLFASDGQVYNGRKNPLLGNARGIVESLPSIEKTVIVPVLDERPDLGRLGRAVLWEEFAASGASTALVFEQLRFDHPLYAMFTSGTTGLPKCMVHGAGGTLIQHLKEHLLHCDFGPGDKVFFFTTTGWMMWNWLVSVLATGATVMLYDGSPLRPAPVLWDFADDEKITCFGTSATYLSSIEKAGLRPRETHDLSALRSILSTGSPLAPSSFDYVYRDIKSDVRLSSISGGTDIISCFTLGSPVLPVRRGELQSRGLGMDVRVFDEDGVSVEGRKGELVCVSSFPSMPVAFWNDPEGARYDEAYFRRFPNVWAHGDYAEITASGGMILHGRSDSVLNPGGVRIGTAEIYRVVEQLDEILESVAVGQERKGDVRIVLFVKLREGTIFDDALKARLQGAIRANASPRHVPAKILSVSAIPRTISGKISETAVRETIHGRPVRNADSLANPEALAEFANRPELSEE